MEPIQETAVELTAAVVTTAQQERSDEIMPKKKVLQIQTLQMTPEEFVVPKSIVPKNGQHFQHRVGCTDSCLFHWAQKSSHQFSETVEESVGED